MYGVGPLMRAMRGLNVVCNHCLVIGRQAPWPRGSPTDTDSWLQLKHSLSSNHDQTACCMVNQTYESMLMLNKKPKAPAKIWLNYAFFSACKYHVYLKQFFYEEIAH